MNMEYDGYLEALPVEELRRQHELAHSVEQEYRRTKEEIALELARRGLGDFISPEVMGSME